MESDNVIFCNNFNEIVDCYLKNFNIFQINKKIEFECEYGSIEFFKYSNSNKIIVHSIYIKEQYRKKRLCERFIKYLIDKIENIQTLVIQSVLSKILYEYISRFEYNKTIFVLKKEGFVAKKI
jgi:hypothetical protein